MLELESETPELGVLQHGINVMSREEMAALIAAFEELEPKKLLKTRGRNLVDFIAQAGELGLEGTILVGGKIIDGILDFFTDEDERGEQPKTGFHTEIRAALGEKWNSLRRAWQEYVGVEQLTTNLENRRNELIAEQSESELSAGIFRHLSRLAETAAPGNDEESKNQDVISASEIEALFTRVLKILARHYDIPANNVPPDVLLRRTANRIYVKALEDAQLAADDFTERKASNTIELISNSLRALPSPARNAVLESLGAAALDGEGLWKIFRIGALSEMLAVSTDFRDGACVATGVIVDSVSAASLGESLPVGLYSASAILAAVVLNPIAAILLAAGLGTFLYRRAEKTIAVNLLESAMLKILHSVARLAGN
ncbi:MAG: hypothetical protein ACYS8W_15150 [Planctomycetota bacterium]|jgi:hypothetical protein